jgi:hypothetical protein
LAQRPDADRVVAYAARSQAPSTQFTRAVRAAKTPVRLDPVADHLAPAVVARDRQLVDGTLEAVEDVALPDA